MSSTIAYPWITTLIQIGIPSIVTLATLIVSYRLGKASHQKDISIAQFAAESQMKKANEERKANLIMQITVALSEVENAHGSYSGVFRKVKIEDASAPFAPSEQLENSFDVLSSTIDKCCGARTAVYLLGNPKLTSLFELYLHESFQFQQQANPSQFASPLELTDAFDKFSARRNELLLLLSDLYLEKISS